MYQTSLREFNEAKGKQMLQELTDKNAGVFFMLGQTQNGGVFGANISEVDNEKLLQVLEALVKQMKGARSTLFIR